MPWDAEFRRRHQPVGSDWTGAGDGDTGDAIQAGMAVGAAPALMGLAPLGSIGGSRGVAAKADPVGLGFDAIEPQCYL